MPHAFRRRLIWRLALCGVALLSVTCGRFPRDPESTLEEALQAGVLQVGVVAAEPWVKGQRPDPPTGVEAQLVERFGQALGVRIEWRWGSVEEHFAALERYELDLVIGGFTKDNPWKRRVAFTLPYYTSDFVVAVKTPSERTVQLEGLTVATRAGSGLAGRLRERGAIPHEIPDLRNADGTIAAARWEAEALGYHATDIHLRQSRHVIAAPPGENALVVRLERFLMNEIPDGELLSSLTQASEK